MIFLTVGTQLPFDRLVQAMDVWAENNPNQVLLGQIGDTGYVPRNFPWRKLISPGETQARIREASIVVAHAGIGTILSALEHAKPILVMPRRARLQEHRNDHQLTTARYFESVGQVMMVEDAASLCGALENQGSLEPKPPISSYASRELIDSIRDFLHGQTR